MMDRALQERIIGAAVLVAFAVMLVPVFLDGESAGTGQIEEPLVLPGQDEGKQKTIVLDRDRDQPVPVARSTREPEVEAPEPAASKPQPEAKPPRQQQTAPPAETSPEPVREETSATGMWAVQLGSFSNQQNAERLAAELRKQGFAAFLSQTRSGSTELHRVRIGPQKDRASAEAVAAKLQAAGHKGQVVPHP